MEGWSGLILMLSLVTGNVEGDVAHRHFDKEKECHLALAGKVAAMQRSFDIARPGVFHLIGACVKTTPEDSV